MVAKYDQAFGSFAQNDKILAGMDEFSAKAYQMMRSTKAREAFERAVASYRTALGLQQQLLAANASEGLKITCERVVPSVRAAAALSNLAPHASVRPRPRAAAARHGSARSRTWF